MSDKSEMHGVGFFYDKNKQSHIDTLAVITEMFNSQSCNIP